MKDQDVDSTAEAAMVCGYLAGFRGDPMPKKTTTAYRRGYQNGQADRTGHVTENADVLRRRAAMILGRP